MKKLIMKKLILLLCLFGIVLNNNAQTWKQADGTLKSLNADLTLKSPVKADLVYKINGEEFTTPIPVCPKYYKSDKILGVRLVSGKLIVKYYGYVKKGEWMGRIVWKEVYYVNSGVIKLQGIVDGNYTPPKTTDESVTFQDEQIK